MSARWQDVLHDALQDEALWDQGVEAARNACVAGAPLAAAAITAAAYYDNPLTGVRALVRAYTQLGPLALETAAWRAALVPQCDPELDLPSFTPGFGFSHEAAAARVREAVRDLHALTNGPRLGFWLQHATSLEALAGALNGAGLCALTFLDLQVPLEEAERRYLLLRIEPALAAAQRARQAGLAHVPFFEHGYDYQGAWPSGNLPEPCSDRELATLKQAVGL